MIKKILSYFRKNKKSNFWFCPCCNEWIEQNLAEIKTRLGVKKCIIIICYKCNNTSWLVDHKTINFLIYRVKQWKKNKL